MPRLAQAASVHHKPKKRQLVYAPNINVYTFLLFFQKGENQMSWSVRDYSTPGRVELRYAEEFGIEAADILAKAAHSFDAPAIPTTNLSFWHQEVVAKNRAYKLIGDATSTLSAASVTKPDRSKHRLPH